MGKSYDFSVEAFASADEFQADGNADEACCFALDIKLTGLSGIALGQALRSQGLTTPMVFIAADDNEAAHMAANAAGYVAFLKKPCPAKWLVDAIRSAQ